MIEILFTVLKETFLAIFAKLAFKTIFERFLTRLVVYSLKKLRDMSSNEVVDDTLTDIINSLTGKGLTVIDEIAKTPAGTK